MIHTRSLTKGLRGEPHSDQAIRGTSLGIERGELVALLGPNGAGTTPSNPAWVWMQVAAKFNPWPTGVSAERTLFSGDLTSWSVAYASPSALDAEQEQWLPVAALPAVRNEGITKVWI